ncbi:hypothetical protein EGT74_08015 [Chitinophaga lutea]|uniref:HNH endonuclease n=1 Tax=Chitinophaga lutea TaxID=2488634 RepID=A0A3N4QP56_9BACT|nr:hypothetical protein [Chitinophaga lutea]RPE13454.1 hypothetical protein EGT74_08015 [Chitinophaga lutea]
MIYTYKGINGTFTKAHEYIKHLVLDVWCKPNGNFSLNKLHPEFIPIVKGVRNKKILAKQIQEIYRIFRQISVSDRSGFRKLRKGFINNNSIEELCKGSISPLVYSEIKRISPELEKRLKRFFKDFYSEVPKTSAFKKACGEIGVFYNDFLDHNESEVCPFCGIADIMTSRLSKRDAFDHYLPKDIYPFNSINPNNLAPICKTCNSSYKLAKSPIQDKSGKKRKAFYPFAIKAVKLEINAQFTCKDINKLKKSEIVLKITNKAYQEQVCTWMDLFGIEERYVDKFCSKEANWWRIQMLDELRNSKLQKHKLLAQKLKLFESNSHVDKNFLKIPYFIACSKLGLL